MGPSDGRRKVLQGFCYIYLCRLTGMLEDERMSGDKVVEVIVTNIRLGGVCKYFKALFTNPDVWDTQRSFLFSLHRPLCSVIEDASCLRSQGSVESSESSWGHLAVLQGMCFFARRS